MFDSKLQLLSFLQHTNTQLAPYDTQLIFSERFETFEFKRNLHATWLELAEQRFKELKKQYTHIRFWYSGGKDSRFVLDLAETLDMQFDQVVFIQHMANAAESQDIYVPQHYIDNQRFVQIRLDNRDYEYCYQNTLWSDPLAGLFNIQRVTDHDHVWLMGNRDQKWFNNIPGGVNLLGGLTPIVFFDKTWCFRFTEYHFQSYIVPGFESFLISESMPEIFNFYINRIIESLESHNMVLNWTETCDFLQQSLHHCNAFRDLVPEFQTTKVGFQFAKTCSPEHNKLNETPKQQSTVKYLQTVHPDIYKIYENNINADYVERATQFGTIMTKPYRVL